MADEQAKESVCSFCHKSASELQNEIIIQAEEAAICSLCVGKCTALIIGINHERNKANAATT